jgi:hypothetical protein
MGRCENGKCICNGGYSGPDCSMVANTKPTLSMDSTSLCDKRYENCSYATVYGQNFLDDGSLKCRITPIKAVETDTVKSTTPIDTGIILISNNQIACVLPSSGSYSISVRWNDQPLGLTKSVAAAMVDPAFEFKAYDTECYVCKEGEELCSERPGAEYCLINNQCYANQQVDQLEECQICNVTYARDKFYYLTDEKCMTKKQEEDDRLAAEQLDKSIRIGVSVGLSLLVVVITIVMLICGRRGDHKSSISITSSVSSRSSAKSTNPSSDVSNNTSPRLAAKKAEDALGAANPYLVDDEIQPYSNGITTLGANQSEFPENIENSMENPGENFVEKPVKISMTGGIGNSGYQDYLQIPGSPVSPMENVKALSRVDNLRRERAVSDVSSVKSLGMGGGAPLQFSGRVGKPPGISSPGIHL